MSWVNERSHEMKEVFSAHPNDQYWETQTLPIGCFFCLYFIRRSSSSNFTHKLGIEHNNLTNQNFLPSLWGDSNIICGAEALLNLVVAGELSRECWARYIDNNTCTLLPPLKLLKKEKQLKICKTEELSHKHLITVWEFTRVSMAREFAWCNCSRLLLTKTSTLFLLVFWELRNVSCKDLRGLLKSMFSRAEPERYLDRITSSKQQERNPLFQTPA